MKYFITLAFIGLHLSAWCQPHNPGKKIFIYLEGNNQDYIYHAEELLTNFDEKRGQFEFWLPLDQVNSKNAAAGDEMVDNIFGNNNNLVFRLALLIPETKNIQDFKSPKNYAVDGMLQIAGEQQEVPVHITLMSSSNSLFYKFSFNVFIEHLPLAYQNVLTGQMVFVVKQSIWSDFFVN